MTCILWCLTLLKDKRDYSRGTAYFGTTRRRSFLAVADWPCCSPPSCNFLANEFLLGMRSFASQGKICRPTAAEHKIVNRRAREGGRKEGRKKAHRIREVCNFKDVFNIFHGWVGLAGLLCLCHPVAYVHYEFRRQVGRDRARDPFALFFFFFFKRPLRL